MSLPKKRKNDINVYPKVPRTFLGEQNTFPYDRRQDLLDKILKSDSYLPDPILHDDLDLGMLEFVKTNLNINSGNNKIPIYDKILTIQRWGEMSEGWNFMNEDNNLQLPFIVIVRKPDPQPGTNPVTQRTIPDRKEFYYQSVANWDGNQLGAEIYKIPQPVAIDISYEIIIVCNKIRDLSSFNKKVLQKFSSRQAYTTIKGHYMPIILDGINDESPIDNLDGRRFYIQNYNLTLLGLLIDEEEFEVKPAINRSILLNEFMDTVKYEKKYYNKTIETITAKFIGDGEQTSFSVGETIGFLFYVSINGVVQTLNTHFYHIAKTSRISFVSPPPENDEIFISYYPGRNSLFTDGYGKTLFLKRENFVYSGGSLTFTVNQNIDSIIHVIINGLIDEEGDGYEITDSKEITLTSAPDVGSEIGITYLH